MLRSTETTPTEGPSVPAAHKLDGLIAWTRRMEWRGAMTESLARHVAQACSDADLQVEDLWTLSTARTTSAPGSRRRSAATNG